MPSSSRSRSGLRLSRRQLLCRCGNGFGAAALTALLTDEAYGRLLRAAGAGPQRSRGLHHPPRADSVIFLYMDGGPSQVDTFDYKPRLDREDGQPIQIQAPPTQFIPRDTPAKVLRSPWKFRQHGESGAWVSELLPHTAAAVDDLCIVRSMVADFTEHANANLFLHTGHNQQGRPSMGAWVTYGLGSQSRELPGYIVLRGTGRIPAGGPDNFHSGFLPASHQASFWKGSATPVANLDRAERDEKLQRNKLDLMARLDRTALGRLGKDDRVEAAITNYELAFQMQSAVPDVLDLARESAATRKLYGLDEEATRVFGTQCLLARRLVERGVRFIELTPPLLEGANRWDQHDKLAEGHAKNARATDLPVAGLIKDLKSRGLLARTLVIWGGEFGRTPTVQGKSTGRDHNPYGFTIWLAGGGVRGGLVHGATDEYGFRAVENKVHVHDLHATMLHLLGIDHKRLTYRHGGRDMRLTDVHGEVVHGLIA